MSKKQPKQHEINSLEDLCNLVTEKNAEQLAEDVKIWLISYSSFLSILRTKHPKETKGKKNTEIAAGGFVWVDDGENKLTGINIECNGEKIEIKF